MVERNGIYDIVPITAAAVSNLAAGRGVIGAGAEVVPLRTTPRPATSPKY